MNKSINRKALLHYGNEHQIIKCMEECGELIQALAKYALNHNGELHEALVDKVREEMADVYVMLSQMRMLFDTEIDNSLHLALKEHIVLKQNRLQNRIEKEKKDLEK